MLEKVPDDAHEIPIGPFVRKRGVESGNDGVSIRGVRVPHRLDARWRAWQRLANTLYGAYKESPNIHFRLGRHLD